MSQKLLWLLGITRTIKARFHYERWIKCFCLFTDLFCFFSRLSTERSKKSMKQTNNALANPRSRNEPSFRQSMDCSLELTHKEMEFVLLFFALKHGKK